MQFYEYDIDLTCEKKRLDVFLAEVQTDISRSFIQKLIEDHCVEVNGVEGRSKYKLKIGDHIDLKIPDPSPLELTPENIPLKIVYEDESIIVIDKPAGMVVHPAPGHSRGTLVNALLYHCADLAGIGGVERPGIVHRLDKETSGLVVVAKTDAALQSLSQQFQDRSVKKEYLALVKGQVKTKRGMIDSPIGRHKISRTKMSLDPEAGRAAQTEYELIQCFEGYSYLRLFPKTGRTHQIRVHLASIGYPILGDKLYGGAKSGSAKKLLARHALHAHQLQLRHPRSDKIMTFSSPLPEDMARYLR